MRPWLAVYGPWQIALKLARILTAALGRFAERKPVFATVVRRQTRAHTAAHDDFWLKDGLGRSIRVPVANLAG